MPKLIENVKENLIIEGRKTLLDKSYRELNIRDVSKNSGIAIGTFYNYFSNKEDFVHEIFKDDWNNTLSLVDDLKNTNEPIKEKFRMIFLSFEGFLDRYMPIFYEISMLNGYEGNEQNYIADFYVKVQELLELEKKRGNVTSSLTMDKLSRFIISNITALSKTKYMTFDELFENIKI